MSEETKRHHALSQAIESLALDLQSDIAHGECFSDKVELDAFCANLDKMKRLAKARFVSIQKIKKEEDEWLLNRQ